MSEPDSTIRTLVDDLTPVGRPPDVSRYSATWWLLALIATGGVMALIAPFRPGVIDQLIASPRFAFESILGLVVTAGFAHAAFGLGIPDVRNPWQRARVALVLLAIWLALFGIATVAPVLEPSMLGKRPLCNLEVLLYAVPLTVAGIIVIRRMMPLDPAKTGAWMGFAAGLIPAWLMQIACMHEPWHIIKFHLAPTIGAALLGALLGYWLLRRKS